MLPEKVRRGRVDSSGRSPALGRMERREVVRRGYSLRARDWEGSIWLFGLEVNGSFGFSGGGLLESGGVVGDVNSSGDW